MIPKKFNYTTVDGNHWPDADKGDNLFYSIDISCFLEEEKDILVNVTWEVPDGLFTESADQFVESNLATIKLHSPSHGSFVIKCTIDTVDNGRQQTNVIPMILTVY
jgi:hypothetical protein